MLFFCSGCEIVAGFVDNLLRVLIGELPELFVSLDGLLIISKLIARNVAGATCAIFPALVAVVGPVGALAKNGQAAAFHGLYLEDLTQERFGRDGIGSIHGSSIL